MLAPAVVALALASGVSLLLRLAGPTAMFIALFVLLALFFFVALVILSAVPLRTIRGGPDFGGGPGRGPGLGPRPPYPSGTREPRRPFPPRMPPREAAAEFDPTA